ncbi:hypothetical protein VNO78_16326 [Psophocarpus tetragonolobus]|uniref:Uncharacterized protein n=1 Tax=Psophocarpus tetragonolobus TaxID=3891 RepID=A0AAN9XKK6_PSOTE
MTPPSTKAYYGGTLVMVIRSCKITIVDFSLATTTHDGSIRALIEGRLLALVVNGKSFKLRWCLSGCDLVSTKMGIVGLRPSRMKYKFCHVSQ